MLTGAQPQVRATYSRDKVDCFSTGADDYVVKPFDARELVARIKAHIRRQLGDMTSCLTCVDLH
jgi:DNA-binding response OmpR family regulator